MSTDSTTRASRKFFIVGIVEPTFQLKIGASNEARTRDLYLGKVSLYQLSYTRNYACYCVLKFDQFQIKFGASNEARTRDLYLGKVSLYQLSYTRKLVPGDGLEPSRPVERGILNPLCLPIPPPGQTHLYYQKSWRRVPESNRGPRICNPLHSHSANPPYLMLYKVAIPYKTIKNLERVTRLELVTYTLARYRSTS